MTKSKPKAKAIYLLHYAYAMAPMTEKSKSRPSASPQSSVKKQISQ